MVKSMHRNIGKSLSWLKRIFIAFLFILSVICLVGVIIYSLFRIAVFDNRLYGYIYLVVSVGLFLYFIYRLIRGKKLSSVIHKIAWAFVMICVVLIVIAVALLYGSLFVRFPLIGYISAPILIFCIIVFLPRINIFSTLKKYFS